jgi:hypothetical protein
VALLIHYNLLFFDLRLLILGWKLSLCRGCGFLWSYYQGFLIACLDRPGLEFVEFNEQLGLDKDPELLKSG